MSHLDVGFYYDVIYKKGKNDVVADKLLMKHEEEGSLFSLSCLVPEWLEEERQEWITNATTSYLIKKFWEYPNPPGLLLETRYIAM